MIRHLKWLTGVLAVAAAACVPSNNGGNTNENMSEDTIALSATLNGAGEVPPVESNTTGVATFEYHPDDDELHYTINVNNGNGITAAHIHAGDATTASGPVVAVLFAAEDDVNGVNVNGELESGTITAADLLDTLSGLTVQELIDLINADGAYVNVHSSANPSGEVRGQIALDD